MIKEIDIKNFRAIKNIKLSNFSKVNIFVGKANMGKTSILEALYLYLSDHPESITDILEFRGIVADEDCFQGFFYDYNLQNTIMLSNDEKQLTISSQNNIYTDVITNNSHQERRENIEILLNDMSIKGVNAIYFDYSGNESLKQIRISKKQANPFQVQFENALTLNQNTQQTLNKKAEFICGDNAYDKNLRNNFKNIFLSVKQKRTLMDKMRSFFKDAEEITMLGNKIVVQKKNLDTLLNFRLMGSGFRKILAIILAILRGRGHILIDEIENGLHFKHIDLLFKLILDESDTQFFITTHNEEILKSLNCLLENQTNLLSVFKVYEDANQNIKVSIYPQEDFIFNMNYNNEMRG